MRKSLAVSVLSLCLLACTQAQSVQPTPSTAQTPRALLESAVAAYGSARFSALSYTEAASGGSTELTGKLDGVPFVVRLPQAWNGDGVLWTHGYESPTDPSPPTRVSELPLEARNSLLEQGFAYAASAYGKRGYAVESGVLESAKLREFLDTLGTRRAYVLGFSMGANVGLGLLERFPGAYSGALLMCGVVSGWERQMEYLIDFRLIYAYFTAGLGGSVALPPQPDIFALSTTPSASAVQGSVVSLFTQALQGNAAAGAAVAQIARVSGANPDPISFLTALLGNQAGLADYLSTTGGNGYSNVGKVYSGSSDDTALNAGITRVQADPAAQAYLKRHYTPNGTWKARVLSVHNTVDPLVPALLEGQLRQTVQGVGNTANLVQQWVDARPFNPLTLTGASHCDFSTAQVGFAWNALRGWVEGGVRPEDGRNITRVP